MLYLSKAKQGTRISEDKGGKIVMAIFHRLKIDCQWRELPIEKYFSEDYSYESVFYYFSMCSRDGSWNKMWVCLLETCKGYLNLSNVQLDGSHARAN